MKIFSLTLISNSPVCSNNPLLLLVCHYDSINTDLSFQQCLRVQTCTCFSSLTWSVKCIHWTYCMGFNLVVLNESLQLTLNINMQYSCSKNNFLNVIWMTVVLRSLGRVLQYIYISKTRIQTHVHNASDM